MFSSSAVTIHFWFSVSLLRWGGAIELMTGSHWVGVDFKQPVMLRIESLSLTSTRLVWALLVHTGAQYSAAL